MLVKIHQLFVDICEQYMFLLMCVNIQLKFVALVVFLIPLYFVDFGHLQWRLLMFIKTPLTISTFVYNSEPIFVDFDKDPVFCVCDCCRNPVDFVEVCKRPVDVCCV